MVIREIIKIIKTNKFSENNIKHFIDDLFEPVQAQTGLKHLTEYLKPNQRKIQICDAQGNLH